MWLRVAQYSLSFWVRRGFSGFDLLEASKLKQVWISLEEEMLVEVSSYFYLRWYANIAQEACDSNQRNVYNLNAKPVTLQPVTFKSHDTHMCHMKTLLTKHLLQLNRVNWSLENRLKVLAHIHSLSIEREKGYFVWIMQSQL